jgi:hypothetical protein
VYVPKWVLFLPVAAAAALVWKEFPALVRYLKIERM